MSSPFSSEPSATFPIPTVSVAQWNQPSGVPSGTSQFVSANPFGNFTIDMGYGSSSYGDKPYGQDATQVVTYGTSWTEFTTR